jgi:prefoldin subunit 5
VTGAGWVQRSPDEAADFCKRKVEHLKKQLDELGTEMDAKQKAIMQINQIMVQRRREADAAAAQSHTI